MTERVYIAGVSMTPFAVHTSSSVAQLAQQAVRDCLQDAGLAAAAVDAVFYANTTQSPLEGQHMVGGQIALAGIGVDRIPLFNIENACASGSSALNLAIAQVRSGNADVALAVGVEKMNVGDRSRSMAVFNGAYDVSRPDELHRVLSELGGEQPGAEPGDRSIFMDIYAAMARAHMAAFGSTQKQIAAVAAKNHDHAVHNEHFSS
ncbi:acetyl-CoA acetyltransferase [Thermocatellispora tengchongensis]|uniref:Acetyl-CoA acetyltransferase n=1 Tax=Thermocatellispora tengchongensis TaxID=1073253 RepID=A0A840PS54_9ACTN|nr:beta-ketoacyl synthase N-terminal-like domain-containing protein [Thermocatellispora tengchongensis]MBB5140581.1 acetyl-CoA acetyltransferase [Thermocatellispora tengchongensis]